MRAGIGVGGESVPLYTLDEWHLQNVSLLKIDAVSGQHRFRIT